MVEAVNVESVIGSGLTVKGDIHSKGTLRVDGKVEGKISANGSVVIGANGDVKADIVADHIIVGGIVRGNITGREKVELVLKGQLHGDVHTKPGKLLVSDGAVFEGSCKMSQVTEAKQPSQVQRLAESSAS